MHRTVFVWWILVGLLARTLQAVAAADLVSQLPSDVDDVVFAARQPGKDGHWYANFGYYAADPARKAYGDGGKLYRLNVRNGKLTSVLEDSKGGVRDPQLHYQGKKMVFSYRKGGECQYHLYEINIDGTGLKQLTDGPFDDVEPSYLPDGGIVFVSTRCKRWVNCWLTQVAVLHRCDGDGKNIRAISSNNEHDNTPWPLPDGRILYTRWEYVDRSQVHFHHLWTAAPDGSGQMVWFGNMYPGTTMIDAKPIPNSRKVVVSFSPGHGLREHNGEVTVIDPGAGPDAPASAKKIAPEKYYRDPWAFSEKLFMAADETRLLLLDENGKEQQIFKLPQADIDAGLQCHEPRPIIGRARENVIASRLDLGKRTGKMILADVYDGRNMAGVKRGEIKKLLVLESLPMPIHYTGGMEPISHGGTFTLERIVGTVPVEADGSAYFELPALRSFFFVALDDKDLSVKRMQSFCTVQPGETVSCVGCHEHRTKTPEYRFQEVTALRRSASKITPITDVPEVMDFPRDIQPILNRHCVRCHDYDNHNGGGFILSGDNGPMYSHSYFALTMKGLVADGRNKPVSNYGPRTLGSSASPLMQKLQDHYGVQLSPLEMKTVRLWIDSGAAYPGTYAALGTGMIGSYAENALSHEDLGWPSTHAAMKVIQNRCADCHKDVLDLPTNITDHQARPPWDRLEINDPRRRISRHMLFNLTRPEKSMLLLAPLSREQGGWGVCKLKKGTKTTSELANVFSSTKDPDYDILLAAISEASKHLNKIKRFDMPGFQPRVDWVREMKRFGILPASWQVGDAIDVYGVEQEYWRSLWYTPPSLVSMHP